MAENDNPPFPGLDGILALEERVWQALVAGDAAADGAMLTDDFLGVYPSGYADRAGHMAELADGPTMQRYALDRARLMRLGPNRAMLSYRAVYVPAGADAERVMYISSLWEWRGDRWLNSFSQDTPAQLE